MPTAIAAAVVTIGANTPLIGAIGIGGLETLGSIVGSVTVAAAATTASQYFLQRTQTDRAGFTAGDSPAAINTPEVRSSIRQATPAQRIAFGETRIGGAFWFYEVDPPYLYIGLLHSAKQITTYKTLYIGENAITLDVNDQPLNSPYLSSGGTPRLTVKTQAGTIDQPANPLIVSDFASLISGSPESGFRLPGIANSVFKFDYGADGDEFLALWGNVQIPDAQWVVQGAPVPDPRQQTHTLSFDPYDVDATAAAETTWAYSNNAALIQAYWAMSPFGLNAGPDNIDWDAVAAAADFDDDTVGLADGTSQKRHTIDGVVKLDEKPSTVMEAMLTANRGFVIQKSGKFEISSSQVRSAIATIREINLIGGFEFRNQKPKRDLTNVVRCRFVAPDRAYQEADGPIRKRTDLIASDGETLDQTIRLPFTSTHQRAQRISKAFLDESRLGKALTVRTDLSLLGVDPGDIVRVSFDTYTPANGLYSVESWGLAPDMASLQLTLSEYDPTIAIDWIASRDEQAFELTESSS